MSGLVSLQDRFAAALLDPQAGCPRGLRAWNGCDAARPLAVNRNDVMSSLVDALADTFPVVQALVAARGPGALSLDQWIARHPD